MLKPLRCVRTTQLYFVIISSATMFALIYELQMTIKVNVHSSAFNKLWRDLGARSRNHLPEQIDSELPNHALLQTHELLLRRNQNLETSVHCSGPAYNQSCLFKNLYYTESTFWILTTKRVVLPSPGARIGAFTASSLDPNRRRFYSYTDLEEFVRGTVVPLVIPNTTLYFDQPWLSNIGHALFDGLYPAYLALIRFQPRHRQPFRILLGTVRDADKRSFGEDVYHTFAGLGIMNISLLANMSAGRWFAFQELVVGSGNMCQRCLRPDLQLPGGFELNGSQLFRDRMYTQHGMTPPLRRLNSSDERHARVAPLRACVIDNKRFTDWDKIELNAAIDQINRLADAHADGSVETLQRMNLPLVRAQYIRYQLLTAIDDDLVRFNSTGAWHRATDSSHTMRRHLESLRSMDIHISGPGTGQMYQTFLQDGSVHINLGGVVQRTANATRKNYTSFMEQYMTAGAPYVKGLYYPINERHFGIRRERVVELIQRAARLIVNGFAIPVVPGDNLAPDGQLFVEMCALDNEFCAAVTDRSVSSNVLCIDTWPENIAHEDGPWSPEGISDGNKTIACPLNRTLLTRLREKFSIEHRT